MPRMNGFNTGITIQKAPYQEGTQIVDSQGDDMTQTTSNALRTFPVTGGSSDIGSIASDIHESLIELRKIRVASEVAIDEEIGEVD